MTAKRTTTLVSTIPKEELIELLVKGNTDKRIAETTGCSPKDIKRFRLRKDVQAAITKLRREQYSANRIQIENSTQIALETLKAVCLDPTASPSARVNAARALTELAGLRPDTTITDSVATDGQKMERLEKLSIDPAWIETPDEEEENE